MVAVAIPPAHQPRLFVLPKEAPDSGEVPSADVAYYQSIHHYPILLPATERMLATRMRAGDTEARHRLYVCNLRNIHYETMRLCRWYNVRPSQRLDLVQHMNLLIWRRMVPSRRTTGYDPAVCRFTTWVGRHIFAEMPRGAEETQALIRRPDYVQVAERRLERDLAECDGEMPLAVRLPWHRLEVSSLDMRVDGDEDMSLLGDILEDTDSAHQPEERGHQRAMQQQVARVIAETPKLTDTQRRILALHYGLDWTLEHVGEHLGISKQRVEQIHVRALTNLRVGANTNAALRALRELL